MSQADSIEIPAISLEWSDWTPWMQLASDEKGGTKIPDLPGVYEVKSVDGDERLTIGQASDLRMRVKQALVRGNIPHSAGARIRAHEDISRLLVQWAVTERQSVAEAGLHERHIQALGRLPKYTRRT